MTSFFFVTFFALRSHRRPPYSPQVLNGGGQQIDRTDPRYRLRRCYKLVSLVHLNRQLDFFFVVAARVICGTSQAQNKTFSGYTKERKTNQFAYFCSA